jgi:hypothetical protein
MPADYHACIIKEASEFDSSTFRTIKRDHEGKEYSVIIGMPKDGGGMAEHSYHYAKDVWAEASARSH